MNKNGFSKKAAGAVASLALVAGAVAMTGSPAAADPIGDGNVGLEIEDGNLVASLGAVTFPSADRSNQIEQREKPDVLLTVDDARLALPGWSIYLNNSALTGSNGGNIDADAVTVTNVDNIQGTGVTTEIDSPSVMDDLVVLTAGEGDGGLVTTADVDFNVVIPERLTPGNYTGTVTITDAPLP